MNLPNLTTPQKAILGLAVVLAFMGWQRFSGIAKMAEAVEALAGGHTSEVCLFGPYARAVDIYAHCNMPVPQMPIAKNGLGEYESALVWCREQGIEIRVIGRRLGEPRCFK